MSGDTFDRSEEALRSGAYRLPHEAAAMVRSAADALRDLGRADLEADGVLVAAEVERFAGRVAAALRRGSRG